VSYAESWAGLSKARRIGVGIVFVWFFGGSQLHFFATGFDLSIMPPYVPHPLAAVYLSGAVELIAAIGLLFRPTRRLSGVVLFLLTLAVTPVHVYMLQYPERFPMVPVWALWLRMVIQAMLLACIAAASWPAENRRGIKAG